MGLQFIETLDKAKRIHKPDKTHDMYMPFDSQLALPYLVDNIDLYVV